MLQIKIVESEVQLQGVFRNNSGAGAGLYAAEQNGKRVGQIKMLQPGELLTGFIEPIFIYPSNDNLGVLAE